MAISSREGPRPDVCVADENERTSSDLIDALRASGHFTCEYPNGLVSAVRLESIPKTRGVHVEVVHVLDLRTARFGKSGLAMRAALLESVNREFETVLHDVGLGEYIERRDLKTPLKTMSLLMLRGNKSKKASLIHPTRTVYVVTRNVTPTMDLSWLTNSGRVVTIEEFALARRSDARSFLPELKHAVGHEKWASLERSIKRGWLAVLALAACLISAGSAAIVLLSTSGSTLPSALTVVVSLLTGLWLLSSSKSNLQEFENLMRDEDAIISSLGDSARIQQSIESNEDILRMLGDISFVVSPLMANLANAIEADALQESIETACAILDECVRLAPLGNGERNSPRAGDEGLARFLNLFDTLGVEVEKESLALSYVALTAHITSPLRFEDMIEHVGNLSYALYNAGALRPDIKDMFDDKINNRAPKRRIDVIDKSLAEPDEFNTKLPERTSGTERAEEDDSSADEELDQNLIDAMLHSSMKSQVNEIPVITAETVDESTPEAETPTEADIAAASNASKESTELVQASLFDFEEGNSSGS
ncbi:MAG: hypothetical protein ACFFEU_03080 [Candidatus Thorarchaeota archaeon]